MSRQDFDKCPIPGEILGGAIHHVHKILNWPRTPAHWRTRERRLAREYIGRATNGEFNHIDEDSLSGWCENYRKAGLYKEYRLRNNIPKMNRGPSKGHKVKKNAKFIERAEGGEEHKKDCERRVEEPDFSELRLAVFCRDGGRCKTCGSPDNLRCHHRRYRSMRTPEEINDLTTLCDTCHEEFHDTHYYDFETDTFKLAKYRRNLKGVATKIPQPDETSESESEGFNKLEKDVAEEILMTMNGG